MASVVSVRVAAERIGVTRNRVRQFIEAGRLPAINIGPQHHPIYVIAEEDLRRFLAEPRRPGRPSSKEVRARMQRLDAEARIVRRRRRR